MIDSLDNLLDNSEYHGTFHDASLVKLHQYSDCTEFDFSLCVGDPDASTLDERERRRSGVLTVYSIRSWKCDPPDAAPCDIGEWLTADGALTEVDSDAAKRFLNENRSSHFAFYLYFSDTNRFLFVACDRLEFRWR